jgi:hypothetical protein
MLEVRAAPTGQIRRCREKGVESLGVGGKPTSIRRKLRKSEFDRGDI